MAYTSSKAVLELIGTENICNIIQVAPIASFPGCGNEARLHPKCYMEQPVAMVSDPYTVLDAIMSKNLYYHCPQHPIFE